MKGGREIVTKREKESERENWRLSRPTPLLFNQRGSMATENNSALSLLSYCPNPEITPFTRGYRKAPGCSSPPVTYLTYRTTLSSVQHIMITFNPPLDETTILNVPFHAGHLSFTATVTDGQLDAGSTIQIWSDIPDNSQPSVDRKQQEWSARSFQFRQNASAASLSIPFRDFVHPSLSQFSFTYRILHPDGRVQWLGDFGKNGSLIVNRYDDRLVLFGDWSTNPLGHSFTAKSTIKAPLQVFSLSDKIQWRYWDLSSRFAYLLP